MTLAELPPGDSAALVSWLGKRAALLTEARDLRELAALSISEVRRVIDGEYIAFFVSNPGSDRLYMFAQHGFLPEEAEEAERTAHERHPGLVVRSRQMLHVPDVEKSPNQSRTDAKRRHKIRSRLFLPIESEGGCIGTLGIASVLPEHFSPLHIASLDFLCRFVGVVHRNLWRLEALELQLNEIRKQQEELHALSAPITEVMKGILVVPVIGRLDAERAERITSRILEEATQRRARAVLLDLTGLASDDSGAFVFLEQSSKALSLVGVRCLLSGLSPQIARGAAEAQVTFGAGQVFGSMSQALLALRGQASS